MSGGQWRQLGALVTSLAVIGVTASCAAVTTAPESTAPARPAPEQAPADAGGPDVGGSGEAPASGGLQIPEELIAEAERLGQPDAAWYAVEHGISVEEAVARLDAQPAIGAAEGAIAGAFGDAYAGLWIEHEPEFRVVIASTDENVPEEAAAIAARLDAPVVWRVVAHPLAQLQEVQRILIDLLWEEGVRAGSSVDISRNAVVLEVLDPAPLEPILRDQGFDDARVIVETVQSFPTDE
jgi:hypothetical protein